MMAGYMETKRPGWRQTEKKYFSGEPSKSCFIEENSSFSGSPLWPQDPHFDADQITANLKTADEALKNIGGFTFAKHLLLNPNRSLGPSQMEWTEKPQKLATTFVSGFLLPTRMIRETKIGFYPKEGHIPSFKKIAENLKGTWLASNLGYFVTQKLIGVLNQRHNTDEYLKPQDNSYLGGFFVRKGSDFIAYPPHFGTCGVGITKKGEPILVNDVRLKGGNVWIGSKKFEWAKKDINPKNPSGKLMAIYTPSNTVEKIGMDRINVVVINEGQGSYPVPKIAYIKDGELLQPAGAVVFSFEKGTLTPHPDPLPQGEREIRFEFEPWFDKKLWNNLDYFYEGLMELSLDGEHDLSDWLHPNAILTQETFVPNPLRREPRNILIETENYFGAFAFSGRYEYSIGISFKEIVPVLKNIIRQIAPHEKVQKVFNLDGDQVPNSA